MCESVIDCGGLETAMEHAIGTFGVATIAVLAPIRLLQKGLETRGIALLR